MSRGPLVVIGDALLDTDLHGTVSRAAPDGRAPVLDCHDRRVRPGGAGLAALLAAAPGDRDVVLITGLGEDEAAERVTAGLGGLAGLHALPLTGGTPAKTRVLIPAKMLLRIDTGHGMVPADAPLPPAARLALAGAAAVLVADYGRGMSAHPEVSTMLTQIAGRIPVVWDPHPRGSRPVPGAQLVTPNEAEALALSAPGFSGAAAAPADGDPAVAGRRAKYLMRTWGVRGVAVTLGRRGAVLAAGSRAPVTVPAPRIRLSAPDTCGAGDSFAAAATGALADGLPLPEAVAAAVHTATRFVAAGAASGIRTQEGEPACRTAVLSAQS